MIPEDNTFLPDIETPFSFPLSTEALDSISHLWLLYTISIPEASICDNQQLAPYAISNLSELFSL